MAKRMRTNIELDVQHVQTIMQRYGLRTKREAVDMALRHFAGQPLTAEQALALQGARLIDEVPSDTGPRGGT
jgi:Arc/MetJ family transcription regulator